MICIYHSKDLDGLTSGAIVKYKFPHCQLIGYDYGQPLDIAALPKEEIFMVDVSMPIADMIKLSRYSGYPLTWIDHHQSAREDFYREYPEGTPHIEYYYRDKTAACELTWEYFFGTMTPIFIELLGKYDTWRQQDPDEWNNLILPFQYAARLHFLSPNDIVQALHGSGNFFKDFVVEGRAILQYQKQQNERACGACFVQDFHGHRALCLNVGGANSLVFDSKYDDELHDLLMPFVFTGKDWKFSLFTAKNSIDCASLARIHGGGGHKGAAGFRVKHLEEIIGPEDSFQKGLFPWMQSWLEAYEVAHPFPNHSYSTRDIMDWISSQPMTL